MIFLWFVLAFLWFLAIVFVDGDMNISTLLWFFLLFLWVGLVVHWVISYRRWRKEDSLRRQNRKEHLEKAHASPEE
jgi:predicted histidine transporter YuiF (NhaC family)